MKKRNLGTTGLSVGELGLGCMGMSWAYAESGRDDSVSIAVVQAALDAGSTLIDTALVYGDGHNEVLVGRALAGRRADAVIATKGGLVVDDIVTKGMHNDGRPETLTRQIDLSLTRLGVDFIDLYYLHRVDPAVPLEDSWGAMAEAVAAGKVRNLGLSEVTVAQATIAQAIHPVSAIQSEFSLWARDPQGSTATSPLAPTGFGDVIGWTAEHGAAFVPFSPLGRGFLTGAITHETKLEENDFRSKNPRFTTDALAASRHIAEAVALIAARHDASSAQVAIAWVLAQGEHIIPIPGTRSLTHLTDNLGGSGLTLSPADLLLLDELPAPAAPRY